MHLKLHQRERGKKWTSHNRFDGIVKMCREGELRVYPKNIQTICKKHIFIFHHQEGRICIWKYKKSSIGIWLGTFPFVHSKECSFYRECRPYLTEILRVLCKSRYECYKWLILRSTTNVWQKRGLSNNGSRQQWWLDGKRKVNSAAAKAYLSSCQSNRPFIQSTTATSPFPNTIWY